MSIYRVYVALKQNDKKHNSEIRRDLIWWTNRLCLMFVTFFLNKTNTHPREWPSCFSTWFFLAYRLLPSIINATCFGTSPYASTWAQKRCVHDMELSRIQAMSGCVKHSTSKSFFSQFFFERMLNFNTVRPGWPSAEYYLNISFEMYIVIVHRVFRREKIVYAYA